MIVINDDEKMLMLDTETANGFGDPMVYDIGFAVIDNIGNVYYKKSYVIRNIFSWRKDLMRTAFYAVKIPNYRADLKNGSRKEVNLEYVRKEINSIIEKYGITKVCAHNVKFDVRALTQTQRYITKSKTRDFFPNGVEFLDTMDMAKEILLNDKDYYSFCFHNNGLTKLDKPSMSAQNLYRYIINNPNYEECHTGLEDVMIEKEILRYCYERA